MSIPRHLAGGLLALGLSVQSGCTATETAQDAGADDTSATIGRDACFNRRDVRDFRALDRSNLIVYAPSRSRPYHVTISPPSMELRSANALAFKSRSSRICGFAGDAVLIGRNNDRRFSVTSVRRLNEEAHQRLLEEHSSDGELQPVEPEETAGAEIERDIDESDQE